MRRATDMFIELYQDDKGLPKVHFHRGTINRDTLSPRMKAVFMVSNVATQEEALAQVLDMATYGAKPKRIF